MVIVNMDFIREVQEGNFERVKYLHNKGLGKHHVYAFILACQLGHIDIANFIYNNIHFFNHNCDIGRAMNLSCINNQYDSVMWLRKKLGRKLKCYNCLVRITCMKMCNDIWESS